MGRKDMLLASRELDRLAASLVRQCDRAKTRVFPGTEAKSGERRTVCWRELDSKFQFRAEPRGRIGVRFDSLGELGFNFRLTGFGSKASSLVCRLESLRIPAKHASARRALSR